MGNKLVRGFTLVEMLVVLSIIMLMTGGAITAFTRFREVRLVDSEAKEVYDLLRLAQSKVLAGDKPSGCTGNLRGYKVNFTNKLVSAVASCNTDTITNEVTLENTEVRSSAGNLLFLPVSGAVMASLIEVYKGDEIRQIEVTEAGGIGAYVEGRVLPTPPPTSGVRSCFELCLANGDTNGTCRRNEASCTVSGEYYNGAGDNLCFGVNGSCCCRKAVPTPTPTPGRAIDSCNTYCTAAGFGGGICNPKYQPGTTRLVRANQRCNNWGSTRGSSALVSATAADKYCSDANYPYCCCY